MMNLDVAHILSDVARILEIKGDNRFRIRAYERAAQNIEGLSEDVANFVKEGRLMEIPGIGKDLADKVKEIVSTGRLKVFEDLKKTIPSGLLDLLNVPSVGPKTAKLLYEKLKIDSIGRLEKAIRENRLTGTFGIKEKTIENLKRGIELVKKGRERMSLAYAEQIADEFITALSKLSHVKKISPAGSLRRRKETVRDIDILMVSQRPGKIMGVFAGLPQVKEVLAKGETKSSVLTNEGIQVDARVVELKSFGAALLYFTGSKNFNIHLRKLAIQRGLKINEYGVFKKNKYIVGETEEGIFKFLGMSYVEPELREDAGEVELALKHELPALIGLKDIKGDLHVHSRWSDGGNSIEEMVEAAKAKGYTYAAITDHSQSLKIAHGLSAAQLRKKRAEIERINKKLKGLRVLFGTEVEIDSQGRLDYKDEILKEFDVVVAAVHSGFKQSKEQLTRRIVTACQNKYVHIIAHPTGRLWGTRDAYELDMDKVLKVAKDTNTHLEINAFPQRLDLNDVNCRYAKEVGVKLAISTDAHTTEQLGYMDLGVSVARRGWLSKEDVINTLPVEELLKRIKK